MPIHEPGLEPMVRRNVAAGRLRFTTDVDAAGRARYAAVHRRRHATRRGRQRRHALRARGGAQHRPAHDAGTLIVDKSTVPVGTADRVRAAIAERACRARRRRFRIAVASNPEFLKEGAAVDDFMKPDRVVIGADDERAIAIAAHLYAPFMRNHERLLVMDVRSAELTKYAANAMLATRISFMNELANLAERLGADIEIGAPGHRLRSAHRLSLPLSGRRLRRQLLSRRTCKALQHPHGAQERTA